MMLKNSSVSRRFSNFTKRNGCYDYIKVMHIPTRFTYQKRATNTSTQDLVFGLKLLHNVKFTIQEGKEMKEKKLEF